MKAISVAIGVLALLLSTNASISQTQSLPSDRSYWSNSTGLSCSAIALESNGKRHPIGTNIVPFGEKQYSVRITIQPGGKVAHSFDLFGNLQYEFLEISGNRNRGGNVSLYDFYNSKIKSSFPDSTRRYIIDRISLDMIQVDGWRQRIDGKLMTSRIFYKCERMPVKQILDGDRTQI